MRCGTGGRRGIEGKEAPTGARVGNIVLAGVDIRGRKGSQHLDEQFAQLQQLKLLGLRRGFRKEATRQAELWAPEGTRSQEDKRIGRRSRKADASGDSADALLKPASKSFGEGISAVESKMKAMLEHMLGLTLSNPLRDQVPQPGLAWTGTIYAERAAQMMIPDLIFSMELDKTARTVRSMIYWNRALPLYRGCSEGEQ